jgi:hypothetical protein
MTYEVQIVRDRAGLNRALPELREFLARDVGGASFFHEPAIIDCNLSHDGVTPHIVFVRRAGKLQCVAPFRVQPSRIRMRFSVFQLASFRARLLTLLGSEFIYSPNADVPQCCALVFDSFKDAEFDLGWLHAIDMRSRLWEYCAAKNGKRRGLHFARASRVADKAFQLQLAQSFDEYLATLGSSTRSSLKRRARKLLTDHAAELVKVTSADQVQMFLDSADAIYSDSWQAKTYGPVQKNNDMEIAKLKHIADLGWLRSYLLTSNVGPLAFQLGYQYGDTFYACDFAFAQKWSNLGPGSALMYFMLEDLYQERPPRVIDLGAGDSPQKRTFRGSPYNIGDYYVVPQSRWRYVIRAQWLLSEIERITRAALVRTGFDGAVRRFLKHKT